MIAKTNAYFILYRLISTILVVESLKINRLKESNQLLNVHLGINNP